jgi:hypothetical protein
MAGLGRKTFNSGDVLNAADVQGYLMDQAVMVFDGTASRGSAIPTPSAGMVAYSTATQLQVYDGSAWVDLSTGYGVATGGSSTAITVGGQAYTLLTFTSSSTLTVTKAGLFDLTIVGGGGSGGNGGTSNGPGGGAGSKVEQLTAYFAANQTITIGAGGASNATAGGNGLRGIPSLVGDGLGLGGGAGQGFGGVTTENMSDGNGGGGGAGASNHAGAASIIDGFTGGTSLGGSAPSRFGGGGGGSAANGGNAAGSTGGAGGAGLDISAWLGQAPTTTYKGGGAGGSTAGAGSGGAGGAGGGAAGVTGNTGNAGTANSGGGGSGGLTTPGAGGSGIIYVRFKV